MATGATTPDGIAFLLSNSVIDPVSESATQASSVQSALNLRPFYNYIWPTATQRTGQANMRPGDLGLQTDTAIPYQYINSTLGWQSLPFGSSRMISGIVSILPTGASGAWNGSQTVAFPANFFPSPPNVFVNSNSSDPQHCNVSAGSVTTAGATIYLFRSNTSQQNTSIYWMAML